MPGNSDEQKNLLPGLKPVLELLKCDPDRVDAVYVRKGRAGGESGRVLDACRAAGVRFSLVPDDALARLAGRAAHQGVVARLRDGAVLPWPELLARAAGAPLPLLVALDQVQDPGNAGTLARTLYALGGAGLVLPRHNSAFLGPGARRAAAGALERLPVAQVVNLAAPWTRPPRRASPSMPPASRRTASTRSTPLCACLPCWCWATRTKAYGPECSNAARRTWPCLSCVTSIH